MKGRLRAALQASAQRYGAVNSKIGFAFVDRTTGGLIGSSRYHGYEPELGQIEIGWTLLSAHIGAAPPCENPFTNRKIDVCRCAPLCGISAPERTMQHLSSHSTVKAGLPIIRQDRYLPCALNVIAMIAQSEGLRIPE
jgi:hypothetical protein